MMYEVLIHFVDLTDGNYSYNEGDVFPREGLKVSKERIAELSTVKNKRGVPLIAKKRKSTEK